MSDWDYMVGWTARQRYEARQLLPRGQAGGEIDSFGNETAIDSFNENREPLNPGLPHIIFEPHC